MKARFKPSKAPKKGQLATQADDLEIELTKALEQTSSELADRFGTIAEKYKRKTQIDQYA